MDMNATKSNAMTMHTPEYPGARLALLERLVPGCLRVAPHLARRQQFHVASRQTLRPSRDVAFLQATPTYTQATSAPEPADGVLPVVSKI
jgi:hypothetical protein